MSNNERLSQGAEAKWLNDIPTGEESKKVIITKSELKEIFQKYDLNGKQILDIDKKEFEKLEAYMKQVEQLKEYKRKIAKQELEKYLVPKNKVWDKDGKARGYRVLLYINKEKRGSIRIFSYLDGSQDLYSILSFRDFKFIIAGTEYDYLSNAFSETDEEEKYLDVNLWIWANGGKVKLNMDNTKLKVTLFNEKNG